MDFLCGLTVIFAVLKLVDVISWSWWLVFLPTIIYFVLFGLAVAVAFIGGEKR